MHLLPRRVGFGFRPRDEELLDYYLKHKLLGNDFMVNDVIAEVDVCKYEPWDLKGYSEIQSDDKEWFFFCRCDYKYAKSTRFNRMTKCGFWKPTGKDRYIEKSDTGDIIGLKKTLVFYEGRGRGVKTNWVIHEYHDVNFDKNQRRFVLCRLIEKPEKKGEGRNDTLRCGEEEPNSRCIGSENENQATDVANTWQEMNMEPTFEGSKVDQCFHYMTQQSLDQNCTNFPFRDAYINKENNNMETF